MMRESTRNMHTEEFVGTSASDDMDKRMQTNNVPALNASGEMKRQHMATRHRLIEAEKRISEYEGQLRAIQIQVGKGMDSAIRAAELSKQVGESEALIARLNAENFKLRDRIQRLCEFDVLKGKKIEDLEARFASMVEILHQDESTREFTHDERAMGVNDRLSGDVCNDLTMEETPEDQESPEIEERDCQDTRRESGKRGVLHRAAQSVQQSEGGKWKERVSNCSGSHGQVPFSNFINLPHCSSALSSFICALQDQVQLLTQRNHRLEDRLRVAKRFQAGKVAHQRRKILQGMKDGDRDEKQLKRYIARIYQASVQITAAVPSKSSGTSDIKDLPKIPASEESPNDPHSKPKREADLAPSNSESPTVNLQAELATLRIEHERLRHKYWIMTHRQKALQKAALKRCNYGVAKTVEKAEHSEDTSDHSCPGGSSCSQKMKPAYNV